MSGYGNHDILYDSIGRDSAKPRNDVKITDAGHRDHRAVRTELENGIFYFDATEGVRTLYLPSAREIANNAESGYDHLLGHVFSFVVRNCKSGNVKVVMHAGERIHYSVKLSGSDIVLGPGESREFLMRFEWVDPERACKCQRCCHSGYGPTPQCAVYTIAPPVGADGSDCDSDDCEERCCYKKQPRDTRCCRRRRDLCHASSIPRGTLVLYQANI